MCLYIHQSHAHTHTHLIMHAHHAMLLHHPVPPPESAPLPPGKYRLAGLVQYIPLPVVGGYLAYVGFFCLVAGASVSMDMPLDSWADITAVVHSRPALYMLAAAVCSTAVLIVAMERCTHPAALPAALVGVPVAFYAALVAMGRTLGDAQEAGWVIKPVRFFLYCVCVWLRACARDMVCGVPSAEPGSKRPCSSMVCHRLGASRFGRFLSCTTSTTGACRAPTGQQWCSKSPR